MFLKVVATTTTYVDMDEISKVYIAESPWSVQATLRSDAGAGVTPVVLGSGYANQTEAETALQGFLALLGSIAVAPPVPVPPAA